MSKTLENPDLPPGAIVETFPDGGARRNDGVMLTPASQNPWYVLATVAGEQEGNSPSEIDDGLHAKNRRFWNGWMCQAMEEGERAELAEKMGLPEAELAPLDAAELEAVEARFKAAFPDQDPEEAIPDPTDRASFSRVHFPSTFVLGKCHFTGNAYFQAAHFTGYAYFLNAQFHEGANFSDGCFKARTVFDGATFKGEAPKFFHREMHQDTGFTDDAMVWPDVTAKNAKEGKRAYTRLRQVAAEIYDPDLEHFFLRQEMRCKARIERNKGAWFHWLFFEAYRVIADSGISVARPAVGLLLAWLVPGFLYLFSYAGRIIDGDVALSPLGSFGLSFANLFSFLGLNRLYFAELIKEFGFWLSLLAGVQTVAGVVLLFFLGLGLRNRFRLK